VTPVVEGSNPFGHPIFFTLMRIELYAFEYFDERRQKWQRARYKAQLAAIAETHKLFRTIGEPEVREVNDDPAKRFPTAPG
jgi:hypothetical protein